MEGGHATKVSGLKRVYCWRLEPAGTPGGGGFLYNFFNALKTTH